MTDKIIVGPEKIKIGESGEQFDILDKTMTIIQNYQAELVRSQNRYETELRRIETEYQADLTKAKQNAETQMKKLVQESEDKN